MSRLNIQVNTSRETSGKVDSDEDSNHTEASENLALFLVDPSPSHS